VASLPGISAPLLGLLLDSASEGEDILRPGPDGRTPLFETEDVECARLLLDRKCDLHARDALGWTALLAAVKRDSLPIVRLLLECRAQADAVAIDGCSALHLASSKAVARLLLGARAPVDAKNDLKQTPLFCAAERGNADLVRVLAAAGADGRAVDGSHRSALFPAAEKAPLGVVRMLVCEAFADPNAADTQQQTPVAFGAASGTAQQPVLDYLARASRFASTSLKVSAADKGNNEPTAVTEIRRRYCLALEEVKDDLTPPEDAEFGSSQYSATLLQLEQWAPGLFRTSMWPSTAPLTPGPWHEA